MMLRTLHIGCEFQRLFSEGSMLVQLDIRPNTQADVVGDMRELPFKEECFDRIWSSHALEHVPWAQVVPTLREWYRVMRWGAEVVCFVPDFGAAVRKYRTTMEIDQAGIFGGWQHEYDKHGCAFDAETLKRVFEQAGFRVGSIAEVNMDWQGGAGPSLKLVAEKSGIPLEYSRVSQEAACYA